MELTGEPQVVRDGDAVVDHIRTAVRVRALPQDVPAHITALELGDVLRVSDLPRLDGVEYLDEADPIASLAVPRMELEEVVAEEEAEELEEEEVPEAEAAEGEGPEVEAPEESELYHSCLLWAEGWEGEGVVLIVGLRNPGPEYQGSRHNVGQEVVERLAGRFGVSFGRPPGRIRAAVVEAKRGDARVILALPYNVPLPQLVLVHDDIDLPFGRVRFQHGGGAGVIGVWTRWPPLWAASGSPASRSEWAAPPPRWTRPTTCCGPSARRSEPRRISWSKTAPTLEVYLDSGLQQAMYRASQRTSLSIRPGRP